MILSIMTATVLKYIDTCSARGCMKHKIIMHQ